MAESDRLTITPLRGPLARLERAREDLAKAWLMRLIEGASLEEISRLPTEQIAAELPAVISDVLQIAATEDRDRLQLPDDPVQVRRKGLGAVLLDVSQRPGQHMPPDQRGDRQ